MTHILIHIWQKLKLIGLFHHQSADYVLILPLAKNFFLSHFYCYLIFLSVCLLEPEDLLPPLPPLPGELLQCGFLLIGLVWCVDARTFGSRLALLPTE